ncbi:uncharacterized protein VP01_4183g1 [Puccinia sorghi]|uniref:Uncharacterized protein n=1 Tax=Puccinia sorghi TaxID=27349 RepID=A0A0L6USU3_9BASI|nr:uncharacterized protein VP01_4183g1 [Puccinia sorghi]
MNIRKRKAKLIENALCKQRNITFGKFQVKQGRFTGMMAFLLCFRRRGGTNALVHPYEWRTVV